MAVSFGAFQWFVLWYYLALNTSYLVLLLVAAYDLRGQVRRDSHVSSAEILANPLSPAVSVIVPAHNEAAVIVDSVRCLLALHYPRFEVIVVDDGSTDATFNRLRTAFDLVPMPRVVPGRVETVGRIRGTYAARNGDQLVVVRKDAAGRRSDASNAGLDLARYPLVCMVDADAILDEDALLLLVKPFVEDPEHVVAAGGCVRAINGSVVDHGRVVGARMPRGWLERVQVVEYLRAFFLGRVAWSRMNGLLIISGAFGLFRRDVLLELGGYDPAAIGEDAEIVARLHRCMRDDGRPYVIGFEPEPVCWTQIPSSIRSLGVQRRRWSRGLAEVLWKHRGMMGRPRYGLFGLVALPYYFVFELLGAAVEALGLLVVAAGWVLGFVDVRFAALFAAVAIGYSVLLSMFAFTLEELSYHRYPRSRDLAAGFAAALVENLGFRQLHAWWRLRGTAQAIAFPSTPWGRIPRRGFEAGPGTSEA